MKVLKNKTFWKCRLAADTGKKAGELLIYGPIGDQTWFGDEVSPKQFREDLQALGDIEELRVYINSPGGDFFAGNAIYSILKRHNALKVVYVDGLAASAASLVAMAGDLIIMPSNALMMIHNPWAVVTGDANVLRKVADDLDLIRESMIAVYSGRTKQSRDKIISMLDAETWMTAKEAVDLGFADEIEEAKKVAALVNGTKAVINGIEVDLTKYRNVPDFGQLAAVRAGVSPEDVSDKLAPEDTSWEAPDLEDFTDKSWDELSDAEKRRIAGHYAWARTMPPETFGDLKLPHHRPSDGAVVWRGVANAAARLEQTDLPSEDIPKVRRHLARHYRQFERTPPWEDALSDKLRLLSLELELLSHGG